MLTGRTESVWVFPIWSWHQRQNWCCGIPLKSLIPLTMLRKLMGQRLSETPPLFIDLRSLWFPPSLPLLIPWQRCLCRTIWCAILLPPPHQANSCWISLSLHMMSLRTYVTAPSSLSSCLLYSHHQSGWPKKVQAWRPSHQHLSLWVRTTCIIPHVDVHSPKAGHISSVWGSAYCSL